MGKFKLLSLWVLLAAIAAFSVAAKSPRRSVLHYMTRHVLAPAEPESNVAASVRLQLNEQGNSRVQKFDLVANGLEAETEYLLVAAFEGDVESAPVATFRTDRRGRARVAYMKRTSLRDNSGSGSGQSSGKKAMPAALDPLTNVRVLGIANAESQVVASATVSASAQFQYLVKRSLTAAEGNDTAAGRIDFKANPGTVNFRLSASGLDPAAEYHLALNSTIVASAAADDAGGLQITGWSAEAPAVLDLRSVALLDSTSSVVLSTSLPE